MHHMAVSFDYHQIGHRYRSIFGDPTNIVAAQIDEHYMFGPLLGVGQQFLFQHTILFQRTPSLASSRQRADRHLSIHDTTHDLR